jgi:hypothetical protein
MPKQFVTADRPERSCIPSDRDDMRAQAQQFGQCFALPRTIEDRLTPTRIGPPPIEIRGYPTGSLDTEHMLNLKAGTEKLRRNLGWKVEVRDCAESTVSVMTDLDGIRKPCQTTLHVDPALDIGVERYGQPGDEGCNHDAAGPDYTDNLTKREEAIVPLRQMVQRPK